MIYRNLNVVFKKDICRYTLVHTYHIAENSPSIIFCMTFVVNLSKRIKEMILLIMGKEIMLRKKKARMLVST